VVRDVEAHAFNRWVGFALPPVVLWQAASSMLGGFRRRWSLKWRLNPLTWYVFLCNSFWNVLLRSLAAYALMSVAALSLLSRAERPKRHPAERSRLRSMLTTVADTYSFAADEPASQRMRQRFWRDFSSLRRECRNVVVVAHSQGGAIAHAALREHNFAPSALIGLGSGLGPLRPAAVTGSWRYPHVRLWLTVLFGLLACTMAGVALFDLLAIATLVLMFGLICVLGVALFITDSIDEGFGHAFALVMEASADLRSTTLWERAFDAFVAYANHALVFSVLAAVSLYATMSLIFGRRRRGAPRGRSAVELPGLPRARWYEFYSPLDPVSVGTPANRFATTVRVQNPTAWRLWQEHSGYLTEKSEVLPTLARLLGSVDGLKLLGRDPPITRSYWALARRAGVTLLSVAGWLLVFSGGTF
jgi:hypothetical protein